MVIINFNYFIALYFNFVNKISNIYKSFNLLLIIITNTKNLLESLGFQLYKRNFCFKFKLLLKYY
jgi:hypothetical protein